MFKEYVSFPDALICYKHLRRIKKAMNSDKETLGRLDSNFVMFARLRAEKGDTFARKWLGGKPVNDDRAEGSEETEGYDIDPIDPEIMEQDLSEDTKNSESSDQSESVDSPMSYFAYKDSKVENTPPDLTKEDIEELLKPLDRLVGLSGVKSEIKKLISLTRLRQKREKADLPLPPLALHMAFSGNPGTGKTTVARMLGDILYKLGYLKTAKVIETDRGGLVGEYIGETAQKTRRVFDSARGGILFIDEAYAVAHAYSERDFGHECLATLVKLMEDERDNTVVIFAGYKDEMEDFLAVNTGLASRIPFHLEFPDFMTEDLVRIFQAMCADYAYEPTETAVRKLTLVLESMDEDSAAQFASARGIRNLFEKTIRLHADRVAETEEIEDKEGETQSLLTLIEEEDIPVMDQLTDGNIVYLPTET